MLLVGERNSLALRLVDEGSNTVVTNSELKRVRDLPGEVHHGDLALVRLAEPSLLGKLLDVSGAVSRGVGIRKRDRGPEREYGSRNGQNATP